MLHSIWHIILGFIAGLIARLILHTHMDFLLTLLLGIADWPENRASKTEYLPVRLRQML